MILESNNFVFLVHQVTMLDKETRKVYFAGGHTTQLNELEFNKLLALVKEKYEIPQVVRDNTVPSRNSTNKSKRVSP